MTHKIDGALPLVRPPESGQAAGVARAGSERGEPVAATPAGDSLRLTGDAENLQALERQLGAPGIDVARVNALRSAIADGSYRVDPEQIASRLVALERELGK